MDPTAYTLLLAMGAAVCAAFISGWLLHMMVPEGLFWVVLFANLAAAPVGLFLPWYCSRQYQWMIVPTVNIFSATLLSILVSVSIVLVDRAVLQKVAASDMMTDEFVRTLIAVAGIAMATSLVVFLVHYSMVQEAADIRRMARKVKRFMWWEPTPKVLLCEDLEVVAPGECAICLEDLASLPASMAHEPPSGSKAPNSYGVLRLPCQHAFHSSCAGRWLIREVNCPMCRKPVGSMSKCVRICLRGPPPADAEGACAAEDDCAGAAGGGGATILSIALDEDGDRCAGFSDGEDWVLTEADSTAGDFAGVPSSSRVSSSRCISPSAVSRCISPSGGVDLEEVLPGAPALELSASARLAQATARPVDELDGDEDVP